MGALTKHKWVSIVLLSVVLPISLLVTFRLTGILPEPPQPETILVEAKSWNGERTPMAYTFNEWIDNYYYDNVASIELQVGVGTYHNGSLGGGWGWTIYDYLNLKIIATANTSEGFIHSMKIEFSKGSDYTSGIAVRHYIDALFVLHNLTLQKVCDSWAGTSEAYLITIGDNKPKECQLISSIDWIFFNQNVDDDVTITLKTLYFNGTAYKKIVTPLNFLIKANIGTDEAKFNDQ